MSWATLGAAVLLAVLPVQEPDPGSVGGRIRSETTGAPIPFAVVEVVGTLSPIMTVADSLGRYSLRGVPAGRRLLRAGSAGYGSHEAEIYIPPGREIYLDFALELEPILLPEVTAWGTRGKVGKGEGDRRVEPDLGRAVVRSLEATSGLTELGLAEISKGIRPGHEPSDPTDLLYIRGAATDLKLVLLDGAPVYAPFQMGGLLSTFGASQIERAELFLGGAPSRYDGGLSYVLDIETRPGEKTGWRRTGRADLLSAETTVEGPLGDRAGLILGGRWMHGLGAEWIADQSLPYGYHDLIGRLDYSIGATAQLSMTGYRNQESVRLGGVAPPTVEEAAWGNRAGSLRYQGQHLGHEAEVSLAFGRYEARLPLGEEGSRPLFALGGVEQLRGVIELKKPGDPLEFRYGLTFEKTDFGQKIWKAPVGSALDHLGLEREGGLLSTNPMIETSAGGHLAGLFLDLDWRATSHLSLRGGLRADHYSNTSSLRLAPRLALVWAPNDAAVLTLAGGRYRQLVRSHLRLDLDEEGHQFLHAPYSLQPARASHLLLGIDQVIAEGIRVGMQGYYKRFDDVPAGDGQTHANASGLDLWVRRGEGRIQGWLGYSLSWVWTGGTRGEATDLFSGRHLLSLGLSGEFEAGPTLGLSLGYGSGLPFSAIMVGELPGTVGEREYSSTGYTLGVVREMVQDSPPVAGPGPESSYLRIDAELTYPWRTKWGESPVEIIPYIRVYNALNRRDSFFYLADKGSTGGPKPLAALPLLPVFGVEWRF